MPEQSLWFGLANNTSLLLALFIAYEVSYFVAKKRRKLRLISSGFLIAAICIAIMSMPFRMQPGIMYDTRTILISVTALTFGIIPTSIVVVCAAIFRIIMGGPGMYAGVSTIISSAVIGLAWRKWIYPTNKKLRWLNIYIMSIAVQIAMLAGQLLITYPSNIEIIRAISLPVMIIFPIATVLLCLLLIHQKERRQYQEELRLSEEKYRRITENLTDIVWTADLELNITYISHSVEKLLGESVDMHLQRSLSEKLPPESMQTITAIFAEELEKEKDPNNDKNRTRIIEMEHYRADKTRIWLSMHISFIRDDSGNPVGIQGISRDITERIENERALEKERSKAQMYLDIARVILIALDHNINVTLINQEGCELLGLAQEDIIGKNWVDNYVPFSHREKAKDALNSIFEGDTTSYIIHENLILTSDKGERCISWHNSVLRDDTGSITGILASGIDVTDQKSTLDALRESERSKSVLISHLPGIAYRCENDSDWTMRFISDGCYPLTGYKPEEFIGNRRLSFNNLICEEYRNNIRTEWERVIVNKKPFRYEYEIITAFGERRWVMEIGQAVFDTYGNVESLEGIIVDITETVKAQEKIQYMDVHDFMTGLHNRRYYEEEKARLEREGTAPVTIIIADINGVRLVNEVFGHAAGDRLIIDTSAMLKSFCREGDLIARTGGDEFTMLLPGVDSDRAYDLLKEIKQKCDESSLLFDDKKQPISLSIGYGTKADNFGSLIEAEKEADEYLRRRKLFEQKSSHNAMLSSIMATMYARSQETEEHSQRISNICIKIADMLGLPKNRQDELHLFSMLHDIGKVGIDDSILKKPGKLTEEEWVIMKTHPEIGYRIVMAAPELAVVADYIMAHHERWDGTGYPQGLAGENIPLLARILAVADAYDAMTEDRIYRKALSKKEALCEVERNAGTQFDPSIANIFVSIMRKQSETIFS